MYETEYLNTVDKRAYGIDNTMYKEFRRTFRIPFELYHDIVEAAYDSGRFRDDVVRGGQRR
jgi:HSP20 family molecular chaperone IbpA